VQEEKNFFDRINRLKTRLGEIKIYFAKIRNREAGVIYFMA